VGKRGLKFQKVLPSQDHEIEILFSTDHDSEINCSLSWTGNVVGRLRMHFILVWDQSVEIFTLTMSVLQIKKRNQAMENIIYFC